MKLNKILEAFTGKKDFMETQAKLIRQLQDYIGTNKRPDLSYIATDDQRFNTLQKLAEYEKAFKEYQKQDEKAFQLINTIASNFKLYNQELTTEVREAEIFVEAIKDLLDKVER
jgi:N-acetylglucosamine kinase-like BadF-type ATPase